MTVIAFLQCIQGQYTDHEHAILYVACAKRLPPTDAHGVLRMLCLQVAAAHQAHEDAVRQWQQQYHDALAAWEAEVAKAKAAAAAAAAALTLQREQEQRQACWQ